LVLIALLLVEQVVNQIVHMKVDMVVLLLVGISTSLVVVEKCHTTTTEKVVEDHHSGISLDQTTIVVEEHITSQQDNGVLVEVGDTILKTQRTHLTVVQVV
jgi:hypothetical protein